jgi:PPOX class probable F420-dependent enzyme
MGPMTQAFSDDIRAFLEGANPAVISTVRPDGQPVSVATWYLLDGDRILVNMDGGRKRIAHLREDPRVSLTVLGADNWYNHVSLQGRVVEWRDDDDLADIDRLARQYGQDEYPKRDRPRISAWIEVDHIHTWGRPGRD